MRALRLLSLGVLMGCQPLEPDLFVHTRVERTPPARLVFRALTFGADGASEPLVFESRRARAASASKRSAPMAGSTLWHR